jgi:hypothetical protein
VQVKPEHLDNQLPVIAKWQHILNVYKFDKPHQIRQLYRFTDTHLNPVGQNAMKVKLAAQVLSHTVAASKYILVCAGKKYFTAFSYL